MSGAGNKFHIIYIFYEICLILSLFCLNLGIVSSLIYFEPQNSSCLLNLMESMQSVWVIELCIVKPHSPVWQIGSIVKKVVQWYWSIFLKYILFSWKKKTFLGKGFQMESSWPTAIKASYKVGIRNNDEDIVVGSNLPNWIDWLDINR